ncbi:MAG: J domain-containing protein [Oscillospiraceae bacterium]|nr:J domain-containing protein [Oscillospiraceae bacterium]
MDNNYRILGLAPGADENAVKEAYRKLAIQYNPDKFADPAQKKWAQQQMDEINRAYDEIMNFYRTGSTGQADSDRDEFYIYIRRLIQQGDYETAYNQLTVYRNETEAEWQFLMGSCLYYRGYYSMSYEYFRRAAQMNPANREYTATYSRMKQSREGNIYSTPYSQYETYNRGGVVCCDPCTLCQCLICMDCCCHH